ncbi:MAG: peptide MFS transporter [Gammaproteobacteria bacterium]|nr:peptide MFS transporter [Gammaproteobacteria bacterium]
MNQPTDALERGPNYDDSFFGHPKGLRTLFFTEMWERMSYYGMRGLLVLFMTEAMMSGGLELTVVTATSIYALYTAFVYFMGLPGGWIADRLIGSQRTVWYGGVIIMCGHIVLAIPNDSTFFIGMILVVLGTGLLKPNIGALVGQLYSASDVRRDSGYALYYMGINIGSVIGYTVCGYLAENVGWHWAFGAAAIGMAIGLIQFRMTVGNLKGEGAAPAQPLTPSGARAAWMVIAGFLVTLAILAGLLISRTFTIDAVVIARYTAVLFVLFFFIYFAGIFFLGKLSAIEKKGMWALLVVCIASAVFWSGFEQAGSSMNLFGRDYTDRMIGTFQIPTTWLQNANSTFIILLSPFFAAFWVWLGKRMVSPAYGVKCAVGLIIMASGFIIMFFAAHIAASGMKAAPYWLVMTYFVHTVGELVLSPVALSAVSKLSPKRFIGQMMGVFVLTYSIGNIIAGIFAGNFDPENVAEMPGLYLQIVKVSVVLGVILLLVGLATKKWEAEVQAAKTSE